MARQKKKEEIFRKELMTVLLPPKAKIWIPQSIAHLLSNSNYVLLIKKNENNELFERIALVMQSFFIKMKFEEKAFLLS